MNSLAQTLIPWAILGLVLVSVFALAALSTAAYGWVKARGGTSRLALLGQLVLEHVVASVEELKKTATTEAAKISADGKVTPEELAGLKATLVKQVMDTLPGHAKAIGSALLGDLFGSFIGSRVDAVLTTPVRLTSSPVPMTTVIAANPSMLPGSKSPGS